MSTFKLDTTALTFGNAFWRDTLALAELYKLILPVEGIAIEFGVRYGRNLATMIHLRGIYEPHNISRQIIGFDTFEGFPHVEDIDLDGTEEAVVGGYSVPENYLEWLTTTLKAISNDTTWVAPKQFAAFELVVGDACETFPEYLNGNPSAIVALAYFDFDLYTPTKACLNHLKPRLTKGSVLAFDQINNPKWPGETLALRQAIGLDKYPIRKMPYSHNLSYIIVE